MRHLALAGLFAVLAAGSPRAVSAEPLPACLTDIAVYSLPGASTAFPGAAVLDLDEDPAPPAAPRIDVRWWANPADVDKSGLALVLAYTRDASPSVVRSISRPLPPSARGHQFAAIELPDPAAGRVLSWRAAVLQRGRVLSVLQSPDWNSAP
ncbi:MAG: hypothetical protein IK066_10335 [Kiritimatiellae bacterium]|nr:hypothetical protein [Kiritimatiellia bacterium]